MKTTTTLTLGLLAALVILAPTALADGPTEGANGAAKCPPIWIDAYGNPHFDPGCIGPTGPVFDNSP
jgi:hypothetical protein